MSRSSIRRAGSLVLAAWLAAACAATPTPEPTPPASPTLVRVAATDLGESLARDLADAYRAVRPDVVVLAEPGAPTPDLVIGADLGLTSAGFRTPLGSTRLAPYVAADFAAPELSAGQLAGLLDGSIADWAQVTGPPGAVTVVTRETGTEAAAVVAARLGVAALSPQARIAPSWDAARVILAQTPGAIGYLPVAEADAGLRALTSTEAWSIALEARAPVEPAGAARDFLVWVQSPAGQVVVGRRHSVLP